jgi:hypothetical protein
VYLHLHLYLCLYLYLLPYLTWSLPVLACLQGELMAMNHGLLCAVGVGHPALSAVVAEAADAGFACKLTGAGGGGCAIILSPVPFEEEPGEVGGSSKGSGKVLDGKDEAAGEAEALRHLVVKIRYALFPSFPFPFVPYHTVRTGFLLQDTLPDPHNPPFISYFTSRHISPHPRSLGYDVHHSSIAGSGVLWIV